MSFFPFFENIDGKRFLIVGTGGIALRKQKLIAMFTDHIRVLDRPAAAADLEGVDYCIASADDEGENRRTAALCQEMGIPVNVPDDPSLCTFYLPSVVKKGELVAAVSTGGKSPALAARVRRLIERHMEEDLPENVAEILDEMGKLRKWLPEIVPDGKERRELYGTVLQALLDEKLPAEENMIRGFVEKSRGLRETDSPARLHAAKENKFSGGVREVREPAGKTASGREEKHYAFFQNQECEYFPCHKTDDPADFNCLFCYCPLYALGKKCGGNFRYTAKGNKDCTNCMIPHRKENYGYITRRYREIMDVVRREDSAE